MKSIEEVEAVGFMDVGIPYPMFFADQGILEERFVTWSMISLGKALNSTLLTSSDATISVLEQRRQATLSKIRELCVGVPDYSAFCMAAQEACSKNPYDVSFLRFYSVQLESEIPQLVLESSTPANSKEEEDTDSIKQMLQGALSADEPIFLEAGDGSLPLQWQDLALGQGFSCRAEKAVISRLQHDGTHKVYGLVVLGLNIRRHLDLSLIHI